MHACPTVQYEVPSWADDDLDVTGRNESKKKRKKGGEEPGNLGIEII